MFCLGEVLLILTTDPQNYSNRRSVVRAWWDTTWALTTTNSTLTMESKNIKECRILDIENLHMNTKQEQKSKLLFLSKRKESVVFLVCDRSQQLFFWGCFLFCFVAFSSYTDSVRLVVSSAEPWVRMSCCPLLVWEAVL